MAPLLLHIDPYSDGIMQRPPIPLSEGILPKIRLLLLLFLGIAGTAIALTIFVHTGGNSSDGEQLIHGRTMVFNFIVLYEMMLVFLIRRSYHVPLLTNPLLWGSVFLTFALQALILYTPLAPVFRVVSPNGQDFIVLVAGGFCFLTVYLLYNYWPWKHFPSTNEEKTS